VYVPTQMIYRYIQMKEELSEGGGGGGGEGGGDF
jgi:hypothetical protein